MAVFLILYSNAFGTGGRTDRQRRRATAAGAGDIEGDKAKPFHRSARRSTLSTLAALPARGNLIITRRGTGLVTPVPGDHVVRRSGFRAWRAIIRASS